MSPHKLLLLSIFLMTTLGWQTASARDYQVEVLVFKNLVEQPSYESFDYPEMVAPESEAVTWAVKTSLLNDQATTIKRSHDYQLIKHYSWGQESLPVSEAAVFSIAESNLKGWIKVYASQLLYIHLDIDYDGYRMQEKRRLKLNERHFFDHPKFGLLVQVSRLNPTPKQTESAQPLSSSK